MLWLRSVMGTKAAPPPADNALFRAVEESYNPRVEIEPLLLAANAVQMLAYRNDVRPTLLPRAPLCVCVPSCHRISSTHC